VKVREYIKSFDKDTEVAILEVQTLINSKNVNTYTGKINYSRIYEFIGIDTVDKWLDTNWADSIVINTNQPLLRWSDRVYSDGGNGQLVSIMVINDWALGALFLPETSDKMIKQVEKEIELEMETGNRGK
jgi:hypothetical protein